jgi:hypothetical protein
MAQDAVPSPENSLNDTLTLLETDYKPRFDQCMDKIRSIPNASKSELELLRIVVEFERNQSGGIFFAAAMDLCLDIVDIFPDENLPMNGNWAANFKYFPEIIDKFPWILVIVDFFHDCSDTLNIVETEGNVVPEEEWDSFIKATDKNDVEDEVRDEFIRDHEAGFAKRYARFQGTGILKEIEAMINDGIQFRHKSLVSALPEITQLDMKGLKRSLSMQMQFLGELMTLLRQKISYEA